MKKSLILAAFLAPSFCLGKTKEEKRQQLSADMNALMLKMIAADHLMILAMWKTYYGSNKEFMEQVSQESLEAYEHAKKLVTQMEELESHE